jgi:short-subunit dehydrogenase
MQIDGSTTALVTGAGSGLGRVIARQLGARGATVWATDRDPAGLAGVAAEIGAGGGTAHIRALDVSSDADWAAALAEAGAVDLLVNNAGVADVGTLADTSDRAWTRQLDINLMGVVRGCRTLTPGMAARRRGHVVNIASFAGLALAPGMIAYNTAKAAVIAFSSSLRVELALEGVGVSVVCPAFFPTNLTDSMDEADPATIERVHRWMAGSGVTAEDVAAATLAAVEADEAVVLTHPGTDEMWWRSRALPEAHRMGLVQAELARRRRRAAKGG